MPTPSGQSERTPPGRHPVADCVVVMNADGAALQTVGWNDMHGDVGLVSLVIAWYVYVGA